MPPRLQCLSVARLVTESNVCSRAAFSTMGRSLADSPSPSSSATDLLAALSKDSPPPTSARSASSSTSFWHSSSSRASESTSSRATPSTVRKPLAPGNSTSNTRILKLLSRSGAGRAASPSVSAAERQQTMAQELKNHKLASDLTRQISRRWKAGDVYAPHDLSPVEMEKWKRRGRPERDVVDVLRLDVLGEYKNFSVMSEYMTPMGRIKPGTETGLRKVNQRKMAKAIRRSIGLGLMPSVHRHPEILYKEQARLKENVRRSTASGFNGLNPM